jgi:hypothetical protein
MNELCINPLTILNSENLKIDQPENIEIELFDHQKTMIYKLMEREEEKKIVVNNYENSDCIAIIDTDIIILCDNVGSGKTLEIIGLQSIKYFVSEIPEIESFEYFSIEKENNETYKLNIDLVIVPHILIEQWKKTYNKYCNNLKVLVIDNIEIINNLIERKWKPDHVNDLKEVVMYINKRIELEHIINYDIILLSDVMWENFFEVMYFIRWRRVVIDEADTIYYPEDAELNANIKYFITATPEGLLTNKSKYLNDMFKSRENILLINYLSIKNDDSYIKNISNLPKINRIKIKCFTPKELYIIHDIITPEILQMINAGNSDDAIRALNCDVDTSDNIIKILTDDINNKIKTLEKKLEEILIEKNNKEKLKINNEKLKIKENLKKLYLKIEVIKDRVLQYKDEMCPVCFDSFTNPCINKCCNVLICYECLIMSSTKTNKCPNCNSSFKKDNIKVINDDVVNFKNNEKNNNIYDIEKMDAMMNIIDNIKDDSVLIFANYEETLFKIQEKFKELSIDYIKPNYDYSNKNDIERIKNNIDNYINKECNILLLNATYYGAGLNLQNTDHIIMYHRFDKKTEEQIKGRAQRHGRKKELTIYYLLHDNENNNFENNIEYNDIDNFMF